MKKWEYKIVKSPTEQVLNDLGADGWELTAVAGVYTAEIAYLKRAKQ